MWVDRSMWRGVCMECVGVCLWVDRFMWGGVCMECVGVGVGR